MKNFARVLGLVFGSARAHTYSRSGQVASPRKDSLDTLFDNSYFRQLTPVHVLRGSESHLTCNKSTVFGNHNVSSTN